MAALDMDIAVMNAMEKVSSSAPPRHHKKINGWSFVAFVIPTDTARQHTHPLARTARCVRATLRIQVDETFQEMVCAAFGVEDEEELPATVQAIDVVKFARMTPEAVAANIVSARGGYKESAPGVEHYRAALSPLPCHGRAADPCADLR